MITLPFRRLCVAAFVVFLAGCEKQPGSARATPDTGAEAVATTFFEALVHEDWSAAYDTLDADSRARHSKEQFVSRAQAAMNQLGFRPTEVGVAVSETGDRATAMVVFREVSGTAAKQYKDGTALRRGTGGWAVALRANFGREATVRHGKTGPAGKG